MERAASEFEIDFFERVRKGIAAEFEHTFLTKEAGRQAFIDAITYPGFVKATNELMSLFLPHGTGCKQCRETVKSDQVTRYQRMKREEKWNRIETEQANCIYCGIDQVNYKNTLWCHLKICEVCYEGQ
jgi:hypothetical protein